MVSKEASLFDNRLTSPIQCVVQKLNMLANFKQVKEAKPPRQIVE
jgi:hypothetical protein